MTTKRTKKKAGIMGDLLQLKETLTEPSKKSVSVTIDQEIYDKIEALKKQSGITKFSPIVNHLLKEYFAKLEIKEETKEEDTEKSES